MQVVVRRAVAVLLQMLMIEMMVIGGGGTCPLDGRASDGVAADTAMSRMSHRHSLPDMPAGAARVQHDSDESAPADQHGGPRAHSHVHCDAPCAPAGCATLASCSVSAVATAPFLSAGDPVRLASAPAARLTVPASVATAPATPPPRA